MREYLFQRLMDKEDGAAPSGGGGQGPKTGVGEIGDEPSDDSLTPDDDDKGGEPDDDDDLDKDDPDDDDLDNDDDDEDDKDEPKGKGKDKSRDRGRDDTDRIARIAQAVASGMRTHQPQPEKKLTDAEVKKILNVYEIDNDTVKELLGIDKDEDVKPSQLKAAQRMVAGIVKNSTTVSNATTTAMLKKIEERLASYDEFISTSTQERAQQRFFAKYDYLKPYEKIVAAVATNFANTDPNWNNTSFEDGAKMVARETRRILKDSGIKVSRRQPDDEANHGADRGEERVVNGDRVPRMASLAGSGRSSTSGKGGKTMSDDEAVYGQGNTGW